jgi:tetratricopeptide (TPR) repeat protein
LELYQRILALTPDSVLGLLGVTQCVMELGDYKEAVLIYSQLIEIAQSNSSPIKPLILAKAFNDRGVAYKRWKQYTNAITDFTESIKIGQKSDGNGLGLEDNLWVSFNNRGVTRGEAGQKLEALVDHNTALKLLSYPRSTDQSGLDFRTALLMNNRGYDYITLKRYSNALADINRAIAFWEASLARHPEFSNYLAMSLLNRGAVFNDIGLFTNAINDTDRTIEILDQLTKQEGPESKIQLAKAYSGRASAHESIGNLTAAVADYGQAIVICQTLASEGHSESAETLARGFQARAVVYGEAGQLQKAIADEDQAVQIFEYLFTHGRPDVIDDLAQALGNRGLSCSQLDQPIIALTNYNRAIELWHNFIEDGHPESTDELLSVLVNRCSTYLQINQITDATVDCDQAIALLESLTNNNPELTIDLAFDRVLAYGARGRARMFSGQETNAVADLTIAIDSLRGTKVNMPPQLIVALSTAYSDRALAYLRLGQPTNELQDVSTAINLLRPLASEGGQNISSKLGIQLFNQGISFNLVGQRTNAFQSYNLAIRQLQPLATNGPFLVNDVLGKAFMNRAVLYHQTGQLTNAMTGFTDAVETLTPLVKNHPEAEDDLGEAFMFRGLAYCGINQLTNALSDLHYSVQLLEDSFEKQQIASSRSDFGKSLAFLGFVLIYNHQTEEAKPYLEKSIALDVDSRITAVAKRALESKSTPEDLELRKIFSSKE